MNKDIDGRKMRIALHLSGSRNEQLLGELLSDYDVVDFIDSVPRNTDMCILDQTTLAQVSEEVDAWKRQQHPSYAPVLLLVESDGGNPWHRYEDAMGDRIDAIQPIPVPQSAILARIESLLQSRQYSQELHRQFDLFRKAQDLADVGAWEYDIKVDVLYWSDETYTIHGHSTDYTPLLEPALDVFHPEDQPTIRTAFKRAIEEGEPYGLDLRLIRTDGEERWVHARGEPQFADGEVVRIRGTIQDIDERVKRETELATERQLVEKIFETSPIGKTVLDTEGNIVRANQRAEEILGLTRNDIIGRDYDSPDWKIFDEDGEPIPSDDLPFARVMETGEPVYGYEHGIEKPDGTQIWLSVNLGAIRNGDGDITYLVSSIEEITERIERERTLERVTETLRTLKEVNRRLVRADDSRATLADIAEIITSHASFDCAFGALLDENGVAYVCDSGSSVSDEHVADFHSDEYLTAVFGTEILQIDDVTAPPYKQCSAESPHAGVALPIRHSNRRFGVLTVHLPPEQTPTPTETDLLAEIAGDIGLVLNSLELKAERERLTENLKESVKHLQVIDHILRHNFNNDMNIIMGHAGLILERTEGEISRSAKTILEESEGLLAIVRKEREITKLLGDPQPAEPLSLAPIIDRAVADVRDQYPDAKIVVEEKANHKVRATHSIETVLTECLTNAVIHSDTETPTIEVRIDKADDAVVVEIADNGPGIPDMERKILTEEAEIQPLYHGSGLGLWLVKLIIARSDGSLTIEENQPRGSVVKISLPSVEA